MIYYTSNHKRSQSYRRNSHKLKSGNHAGVSGTITAFNLLFFSFRLPRADPLEVGVDEGIQVTVHHRVHISRFMAGSVILHHGVGLEYVGTDLVAPADFLHLSTNAGKLLRVFLLLEHIQLRLQHLHGFVLILELGTFVLTLHHDSRRNMGNTYS